MTTMAKRMQEQEGEQRIVAKVKADDDEHGLHCYLTVQFAVVSKSPGILKAPCRTDWSSTGKPDAKEHNQDEGWQKDTVLDAGTRKLVATEEDQEHLNYPEESVRTRKLVASGNSETEGSDKDGPHNLQKSTNYVLFRLFFCQASSLSPAVACHIHTTPSN